MGKNIIATGCLLTILSPLIALGVFILAVVLQEWFFVLILAGAVFALYKVRARRRKGASEDPGLS